MELTFLGGVREVGRSAVLVDDRLLLDFGGMPGSPPRWPVETPAPEAVVVSHGHFDHAGAVPALCSGRDRPEIHWTPPTRALALTLARDTLKLHGGTVRCPFIETDVKRVTECSVTHGYGESFGAAGYEVTLFDAGHIPGSAHVLVDDGETRLLYTGDLQVQPAGTEPGGTRDVAGSDDPATADPSGDRGASGGGDGARTDRTRGKYTVDRSATDPPVPTPGRDRPGPPGAQRLLAGSTARPDADVVVTESTYAGEHHPARADVERRFLDRVERTLYDGGTVVAPAFAIGRTQELLLVCAAHEVPCYVDGMGVRVAEMLRGQPAFLRDGAAYRRALSHARVVDGRDGQRRRIAEESAVIVTTSGTLAGGPAMTYLPAVADDPTNAICLTGYQPAGTPGRELLEDGRVRIDGRVRPVSAAVEAFHFSAHADDAGLRSLLDEYRDSELLVGHGDRCEAFAATLAADGWRARAPAVGETVVV